MEPTCTTGGYQVQVCDCGDIKEIEPLNALGHYYENGRCIRCGKSVPGSFSDVKEKDYYYQAVMWAIENGITSGIGNGKFGPKVKCTREQVMTFLWAANGSQEPTATSNPFKDVKKKDYFYKAVLWAVENGITGGTTPNTFSPKAECTRGQVVTFFYAAFGNKG